MLLRTVVLGVWSILALVSPLSAFGQDELRWKLQEGETLKYQVQQNMQTEMTVSGQKINTSMQQAMDMSWRVGTMSTEGDAAVTQTVDRVQMKM